LEADTEVSASLSGLMPLALTDREGHPDAVETALRLGTQPLVHVVGRLHQRGDLIARAALLRNFLLMEGAPDTVSLVRQFAARLPKARLGVVVNPFLTGELERLHAKVAAGAHFYVAQAGWDDRAYQELLAGGPKIPALASVLCVGPKLARAVARGEIVGVRLPPGLATDHPIERLAERIRTLLTMGFSGVHIAGIRRPETVERLLALLQ